MTGTKPQHAPQIHFPVVDDVLQVGGIALTRLALRVGRTPFYAIDRAVCSAQVRKRLGDDFARALLNLESRCHEQAQDTLQLIRYALRRALCVYADCMLFAG
jgi:hypothetical protein